MTIIDSALRRFAPQWALKREVARVRLEHIDHHRQALNASYEAAERSRTTADWPARPRSADQAIVFDMRTMNARARAAVESDWVAGSIVDGYRRHLVGKGIVCRSNARDAKGEPLKEFNEAADELFWDQWGNMPRRCDIEGIKTFVEFQGLIAEESVVVGQSILIWSYSRQRDHVGMKLQLIEPEQLATDMYRSPRNGNEIRNGIEIGRYGERLAFWVYTTEHPLETGYSRSFRGTPQRIPADQVLHFMRQKRVRQTHGVTRMATVLKRMRNLGMYEDYTAIRARLEACIGAVITSATDADGNFIELGLTPGTDSVGATEQDSNGNPEWNFEPGMNPQLPPGKDIKFHTPTTPGTTFEPFTLHMLHAIAAGAGLDFGTVAKDYRQGSFISMRMGTLERDREIEPLQKLMIDLVLRPIRNQFITLAVMEGRLEAPDFFTDPAAQARYLKATWHPPAKPPIDPARHYAAAKLAIEQRLKTRAAYIAENEGEGYERVFDQIDDEQEYAHGLGIGLPDAPAHRGGTGSGASAVEPRPNRAGTIDGTNLRAVASRARHNGHAQSVDRVIYDVLADSVGAEMATALMEDTDS